MNVLKMILSALKEVILSFTPNRSFYEAMMKCDFKIGERRQNLMQLCFSPLANGPLLLIIALIWLDPTRYLWSLQTIFGEESSVCFFLLNGQISTMLITAAVFFLLEWIFRKEYFFIAILFYFLAKSDLHLHLALAGLNGVYLARACYLWWFGVDLKSRTKNVWRWVTSLQLFATVVVMVLALVMLDDYQREGYFSGSLSANRFVFLFWTVMVYQFFIFVAMALWGHFSFQKQVDPTFISIHYSTANWILRFKMSFLLRNKLKEKTDQAIQAHLTSLAQIQEMKDQSPGVSMAPLEKVLHQELASLHLAASRLTID